MFQLFGDASVAQSVLSKSANGDFFSINWGWGIGAIMGVLIAGGVSGKFYDTAVHQKIFIYIFCFMTDRCSLESGCLFGHGLYRSPVTA